MALANPSSGSSHLVGLAGRLAWEAMGYIELGLTGSIANAPGLAKYETPPRDEFTTGRLIASIRLTNERFRQLHPVRVSTSVIAVHATETRAFVVGIGPQAHAWRVHQGRFEPLMVGGDPIDAGEMLGVPDDVAPRVVEVEDLAVGDLIVLGWPDPVVVSTFERHFPRLDTALACCAALEHRRGLIGVVARWVGGSTHVSAG